MKMLLPLLVALGLALPLLGQEPKKDAEPRKEDAPPPALIDDAPAPVVGRPPMELILEPGQASAVPFRKGVSYANGGVIDISQPNPTTIVIVMSGLTATNADLFCKSVANYSFELSQCFEVAIHSKQIKAARLVIEGRVIGLLRTNHEHYQSCLCKKGGVAETQPAHAAIAAGGQQLVALTLPARSICCQEDLSVYNHEGPLAVPVAPGKFTLHQTWGFGTVHPAFCCRGASAEFAPQPQHYPDSYWFQAWHPFNGTATKDFGFTVTIKLQAAPAPRGDEEAK